MTIHSLTRRQYDGVDVRRSTLVSQVRGDGGTRQFLSKGSDCTENSHVKEKGDSSYPLVKNRTAGTSKHSIEILGV